MNIKCKCVLCGKEYDTCNCGSDMKNHAWKVYCDTSEHYQIHLIVNDYAFGNIDKKSAKKLLSKFDLSNYKNFNKRAVETIDEILKEEPKVTKKVAKKQMLDEENKEESNNVE